MTELIVVVYGESIRVTLTYRSRRHWIARGEYLKRVIETEGKTDRSALARWREVAALHGG
jgi:hypothetical protein